MSFTTRCFRLITLNRDTVQSKMSTFYKIYLNNMEIDGDIFLLSKEKSLVNFG